MMPRFEGCEPESLIYERKRRYVLYHHRLPGISFLYRIRHQQRYCKLQAAPVRFFCRVSFIAHIDGGDRFLGNQGWAVVSVQDSGFFAGGVPVSDPASIHAVLCHPVSDHLYQLNGTAQDLQDRILRPEQASRRTLVYRALPLPLACVAGGSAADGRNPFQPFQCGLHHPPGSVDFYEDLS